MTTIVKIGKEPIESFEIPEIMVTKSLNGLTGTASFIFKKKSLIEYIPKKNYKFYKVSLSHKDTILNSSLIKLKFFEGHPVILTIVFTMKNYNDWEVFNNFMISYSKQNKLTFKKFKENDKL